MPNGNVLNSTLTSFQINPSSGGFAVQTNSLTKIIEESTTTEAELSYVHGVTSPIQTQLDLKQDISGLGSAAFLNASTTTSANTVVERDSSGNVVGNQLVGSGATLDGFSGGFALYSDPSILTINESTTTETELSYVHGVTSPIQTQINSLGEGWHSAHVLTAPVTLTNPCPNFIYIDATSTGPGPLVLPAMNAPNSLSSTKNTFIFIKLDEAALGQVVVYDSASNNLFTIYPGQIYLLTVKDNANQGDFNITLMNKFLNSSSPLSVDVAGNLTITESNATTDGYLSSTDWNIFSNKLTTITTPNLAFINGTNGTDVNTSGSINQPFKSWSYAETQITTASATNPFTIIILGGELNDTGTISKKPYINVKGETAGTIVNNSNPIVLDASWTSNVNGAFSLQDFSANQMNFDASIYTSVSPQINLANINCTNFNFKAGLGEEGFIYFSGCTLSTVHIDCAQITSFGNYFGNLNCGTISLLRPTYLYSTGDSINQFTGAGPSSGFMNIYQIYGASMSAAPSLSGNNCTLNIDAGSLGNFTPTITSGTPVVNLKTGDTSVNSSYSPSNFTKTASTVRGMITGIDNKLATLNQTVNQVLLGNGSTGITSSANLTYVSSQVIASGAAGSAFVAAGSQSFFGIGSTTASSAYFAYAGAAGNWFTNSIIGDANIRVTSTSNFLRLGVGTTTSQLSISNTLVSSNVPVAIGATSANASCMLDIVSTTKGIGNASGTTTQKNAISSPRVGMQFFDTTLDKLCIFTASTGWQTITSV